MLARRGFILGASAILAAPAIVRVASIMPVSVIKPSPIIMGLDLATQAHMTAFVAFSRAEGFKAYRAYQWAVMKNRLQQSGNIIPDTIPLPPARLTP